MEESEGINFIARFNPFASSTPKPGTGTTPVDVSGYEPGDEETTKLKLMKVSSMPVAGYTVFAKERFKEIPPETSINKNEEDDLENELSNLDIETLDEETEVVEKKTPLVKPTPPATEFAPALRYVARATGNIYQTFVDKIEEKKFSNTTVPKVYEALLGNSGESVVMRYLKEDGVTIETFVGTLPKEYLGGDITGENEIKGTFLPQNIKDISILPNSSKIFYLFEIGESMIGTTLNLVDNKKVQVFDSVFTEWSPQWENEKTILLSTKPSGGVSGYTYSLDLIKKNLTKVLGEINGLTTLGSPDGKSILYTDNGLLLSVYSTDSRNSSALGLRTLPEKCVFGGIGNFIYCAVPKSVDIGLYPDIWYQGEVSFSDQFWKIDIETGNATLLIDPSTVSGGEEIDGIKLSLDKEENYLFFVNKKDSFLWELNLR